MKKRSVLIAALALCLVLPLIAEAQERGRGGGGGGGEPAAVAAADAAISAQPAPRHAAQVRSRGSVERRAARHGRQMPLNAAHR